MRVGIHLNCYVTVHVTGTSTLDTAVARTLQILVADGFHVLKHASLIHSQGIA